MSAVARVYAKALFEAANEAKLGAEQMDRIESELKAFAQVVESSKEATIAFTGPVATTKEKAALAAAVARKLGASELVSRFVTLLASKDRVAAISEILPAFQEARLVAEGGVPGWLSSAEPVNEADVEGLARAFSRKLGKKVKFNLSTDPSLLAGVKVVVNGVTYDGTLRAQLQKMRDRVVSGAQIIGGGR